MRICVNAAPRTGATTFIKWLSLELKLQVVNEPFNDNQPNLTELQNMFYHGQNIVAKITGGECNRTNKKDWDYMIGLTRDSLEDSAESYAKAILLNNTKNDWHLPYVIDENWIEKNKSEIEHYKNYINTQNNYIFNNKDIDFYITYEDIYYSKVKLYNLISELNIENKFIELLNPKKRYRRFKKNII